MLHQVQLAWVGFELTTSVVIGTDCIGSCIVEIQLHVHHDHDGPCNYSTKCVLWQVEMLPFLKFFSKVSRKRDTGDILRFKKGMKCPSNKKKKVDEMIKSKFVFPIQINSLLHWVCLGESFVTLHRSQFIQAGYTNRIS